jgi:hypothetical protein
MIVGGGVLYMILLWKSERLHWEKPKNKVGRKKKKKREY